MTPNGVVAQAVLAFMGTFVGSASLRLTAWGASGACFYGYLCGLCPKTPIGVWRKRCLLLWVPVLWALPTPARN